MAPDFPLAVKTCFKKYFDLRQGYDLNTGICSFHISGYLAGFLLGLVAEVLFWLLESHFSNNHTHNGYCKDYMTLTKVDGFTLPIPPAIIKLYFQ